MDDLCHEFVCADCKAYVFSFAGDPEATRCHSCNLVQSMKPMTKERETKLREILGVEIPEAQ